MSSSLGDLEQLVLLATLRLGDGAYGVTIRDEIDQRAGRQVTLGSIYKALERLEKKGLLGSRMGEPEPVRGGRRRRLYRLHPAGQAALDRSVGGLLAMLEGLER